MFELPYVFPTKQAFYAAVDDGFFQKAYSEVEGKGAKLIGVLPFDYLVPARRNALIRGPRDLAGLKLRGLGRSTLRCCRHLGATPVSLNFVELSPAIQQGVIDGLNVPTDNYMIYKWNECIKHVTYAPYYVAFYPWMVNAAWWDELDPELRDHHPGHREGSCLAPSRSPQAESQKAIEGMRAGGIDVHVQTPERQAWIEATQPVWKQFEAQIGPDLLEACKSYSKRVTDARGQRPAGSPRGRACGLSSRRCWASSPTTAGPWGLRAFQPVDRRTGTRAADPDDLLRAIGLTRDGANVRVELFVGMLGTTAQARIQWLCDFLCLVFAVVAAWLGRAMSMESASSASPSPIPIFHSRSGRRRPRFRSASPR